VIANESETVRQWLLNISVLDRFCGSLCETLCDGFGFDSKNSDSLSDTRQDLIGILEADNLFIIPLDEQGEWFRFHHLFRDLLAEELVKQSGETQRLQLHARASVWFAQNGLIDEAIFHAVEAGEVDMAIEVIAQHRAAELDRDNWFIVERWLERLPAAEAGRSELLLANAWIAYERYQLWRLPGILEQLALAREQENESPRVMAETRFFDGAVAYFSGATENSHRLFSDAREHLPIGGVSRGLVELLDGLSLVASGRVAVGIGQLEQKVREVEKRHSVYFSRLLAGLVFARIFCGDLGGAIRDARWMESVATDGRIRYTIAWARYMVDYWADVKPIIDRRCVVCHGCYQQFSFCPE
jgi:LuxR family maltose regulon positive regulatory protein